MERLHGKGKRPTSAEVVGALRAGAVVLVAVGVLLGPADHGTTFLVVVALAAAYAAGLAVLAVRGTGEQPLWHAVADVGLLLALIASSGGALSEARFALMIYPVAMGLANPARAIAIVTALAAAGFVAVSASSLGEPQADTAFAETLVALLVVGGIGVLLARSVRRRTLQLRELGADRAALLHEALDAEERERARIGERLHDDTLQSLLAAQQDVREARSGYLQSLEYADEALTDAVRALRDTVMGLHPASLADRGLGVALDVELDRAARRTKLEVDLHVDPDAVGPHDAVLYAAARELITNAVKHADATRLVVRLERMADAIVLRVEDDGRGMVVASRPEQALQAGHVGLASTRQRIGAAGGVFEVQSAPGEGTRVRVAIPVRVAEQAAVAEQADDPARIQALRATGLLDGPADESLDGLARLAARLLEAPVALISLIDVDREFLAAQVGVPEPWAKRRGWPLTHSLARFAVANNAPLVVADARTDAVLYDSSAIGELGIVAYAAVPLTTASGRAIGALSVADRRARVWTEEQLELLHELARIARRELLWGAERSARSDRGGDEVESERRFIAAVLESLGEGVIASDERGELRIVNAAARRFGESTDTLALELLAERGQLHLAATGAPVAKDDLPLPRALRGEDVADEEYLAGDLAGERRWLVLAGHPIAASSGARGAIMTIRDVTEQRLAQAASLEAQARFQVAFDHAPVGMGIAGLDGRFWSANLALAKLTGWRLEQLRSATLESLLHPDEVESSAAGLQALAEGSTAVHVTEKRLLHADGHEIWSAVHVAVIRDGAGRPQHLLLQLQDLTERRREEERLRTLSDRDELTLLLNRTGFARELRRHAARVERYGTDGGVLMIDVDGLKAINAAIGRGGGDDVLRRLAIAIESRVRRSDFAARIGEDEFAVLLPRGGASSLMALADDLLERLDHAQAGSADRIGAPITVSMGAAVFGAGATEADTVLQRAATAMAAASRAGGGRAVLFGPAVLASPLD
ncbi:MAG TPA: diguanylate cyclase [Solirubrobacteraceae bacterium]|nr:diguanylate cyclase [Solirubrobacteraceae bacterium]